MVADFAFAANMSYCAYLCSLTICSTIPGCYVDYGKCYAFYSCDDLSSSSLAFLALLAFSSPSSSLLETNLSMSKPCYSKILLKSRVPSGAKSARLLPRLLAPLLPPPLLCDDDLEEDLSEICFILFFSALDNFLPIVVMM